VATKGGAVPPASTPALELRGVRKRFGRRQPWVLDGVDLIVVPGEVVQIAGTNGSGKSTLLRVAAGLVRPAGGSVERRGRATFAPERAPAAAPMTVATYLGHQARLQGLAWSDVARAVGEVVARHRLEPVAAVRVDELSKGWTQRTLLAQALLAEPDVVFLDEPWSGVDAVGHEHAQAMIDEARAAGRAIVLTSHEPVGRLEVRRLRLVDGRLVEDEPPPTPVAGWRRVNVRSRRGDAALPPGVLDHPGVLGADPVGGEVVVQLRDDAAGDDALARLLDAGWTPVRIDGSGP
jgi:ABC-2 type transport system ATP-binding protein